MASDAILLLFGEDTFALKAAEAALVEKYVEPGFAALNLNVLEGATVATVVSAANTPPFGPGHRLVVVRDCAFFSTKLEDDEIAQLIALAEKGLPERCVLAFVVPRSLDGRLKQTSALKDKVERREFAAAKPWESGQIVDWLAGRARELGYRLEHDVAQRLVASQGTDRFKLESELRKLGTYAGKGPITGETLALLAAPGESDVFEVMRSLAARKPGEAIARLHAILVTEPAAKVVATMATLARKWLTMKLLAEKGMGAEAIAQALKTRAVFPIKRDLGELTRWNSRQLAAALSLLLETDGAIKGGAAKVHERLQLERLVIQIVSLR